MRKLIGVVVAAGAMAAMLFTTGPSGLLPSRATAANLQAKPWVYVGNTGDCGAGYAAGSNIVTSGWLGGLGLPDNGGQNSNTADPTNNPNKNDPHKGLLLSKNGPTPDCSSSGATITGVKNMTVPASGLNLGFDYRVGGHCGAGAPRFDVTFKPPTGPNASSFVGGCANMTQTPAPQDAQWMTAVANTSNAAQAFPVIPPGSKIVSIDMVFDEGTDTSSASDPTGVGLATLDNILVGTQTIRSGDSIAEPRGPRSDKHDKEHGGDNDNNND